MVTFTIRDPAGNVVLPPWVGIVDSGADGSMFPMDQMADLGISKGDCDVKGQLGAGGRSTYYAWRGATLAADVYGVKVKLKVRFSDTPFILLGREDFFSVFKVSFDQRRLRFTIQEY